ncbi:MAG: hypothetical protein SGJ10_02730 [Bacteroidota bacterium]|nr:hypothetical protein [Bacteroidota bacterium]
MKKTVLFVAVIAALSFASCKKDRTCTCTTTSTMSGATPSIAVVDFPKSKKGAAQAICGTNPFASSGKNQVSKTVEHYDAKNNQQAYTVTTDCVLK